MANLMIDVQGVEKGKGLTGLILAFAAVYLIWGSTYLAIRFAIETAPPFLMMGIRFIIAGSLMYGWLRVRGAARPALREWGAAALIGGLLLLGGTGADSSHEGSSAAMRLASHPGTSASDFSLSSPSRPTRWAGT